MLMTTPACGIAVSPKVDEVVCWGSPQRHTEISYAAGKLEVLYEDEKFGSRQLAALVASKIFFYLEVAPFYSVGFAQTQWRAFLGLREQCALCASGRKPV